MSRLTARPTFGRSASITAMSLAGAALVLTACVGPPTPPLKYSGQNPRADIALKTAAEDLGCPLGELRIMAESRRKYLNESSFRWVIEGCGERAGYFETCDLVGEPPPPGWTTADGSLACRDVLMTRIRIAPGASRPEADEGVSPSSAPTLIE